MDCVANYEIKTECSIITDDLVLNVKHPRNVYRARIKNIHRSEFSTPFLLSLHLYFSSPDLDKAQDIADELLAECLNMLTFATGSGFKRYRIRQIVDATSGIDGMRSVLMWGDSIEHEDPQPMLNINTANAIERILEFEVPPAIRRALRWYRLGVNSGMPDDQFMYFWFALEIIAEYQKSSEKVPDRCPYCKSELYCEKCQLNPLHRPYPKQAIRSLLKLVAEECDDAMFNRLEQTRHSLMHGSTLQEIEQDYDEKEEHTVDILGRLVWKALIFQFPHEMFDGTLEMGYPNTYLHHSMRAVAHMQTVVPVESNGDFDLSFTGFKMGVVPPGPPQSALPTVIRMTVDQHERLGTLRFVEGNHQEMCKRIYDKVKMQDGHFFALVFSTDLAKIKNAIDQNEQGNWQDLFREIIEEHNKEN